MIPLIVIPEGTKFTPDTATDAVTEAIARLSSEYRREIATLKEEREKDFQRYVECIGTIDNLNTRLEKLAGQHTLSSITEGFHTDQTVWRIRRINRVYECPPCGGEGYHMIDTMWGKEAWRSKTICPYCDSTGKITRDAFCPEKTYIESIQITLVQGKPAICKFRVKCTGMTLDTSELFLSEVDCLKACVLKNRETGVDQEYPKPFTV